MRTPGFQADKSLYRSTRSYRGKGAPSHSAVRAVVPQQNESDFAGGTCCGVTCPSWCSCSGGVAKCGPATTKGSENRVTMALSLCHASGTVVLPDGSLGTPIAICPGDCWASTYDAGCLGGG